MSRLSAIVLSVLLTITLCIDLLPTRCNANSNGGPSSTCPSAGFVPSHRGAAFSTNAHGYVYTLTPSTWTAGQSIQVTLKATGAYSYFDGHMIAVVNSARAFQGSITFTGSSTKYVCTQYGSKVAITQPSASPLTSLSFTWTAPSTAGLGTLTLTSTLEYSLTQFWRVTVSIPESPAATTSSSSTSSSTTTTTTTSTTAPTATPTTTSSSSTTTATISSSSTSSSSSSTTSSSSSTTSSSTSSSSSSATSHVPGAPSSFMAINATKPFKSTSGVWMQNVTLIWTAPSDVGVPALTGYRVQINNGTIGDAMTTKLSVVGRNATFVNLIVGRTYQMQVMSYSSASGNVSLPSNAILLTMSNATTTSVVPSFVSSSLTVGATSVTLSWNAWNSSTLMNYQLEMRLTSGATSTYTLIGTQTSTSVIVSGLQSGTSYSFRIRAVTTAGVSGYSAEVSALTSAATGTTSTGSVTVTGICPNACSGHGTCSSSSTCMCDAGFLGLDCSIPSGLTAPICTPDQAFCFDYNIVNGTILVGKIQAVIQGDPNTIDMTTAYTSIGFGGAREDGMTGANILVAQIPTQYLGLMYNYQCTGLTWPDEDDGTMFDASSASGYFVSNTMYITFIRPLRTSNAADYVIPSVAGTRTVVGWANDPVFFNQHTMADSGRGICYIDFASFNGKCIDSTHNYAVLLPIIFAVIGCMFFALAFRAPTLSQSTAGVFLLQKRFSTLVYQGLSKCFKEYNSASNTAATSPAMRLMDTATLDVRRILRDATYGDLLMFVLYAVLTAVSIVVGYSNFLQNPRKKYYLYAHLSALQMALTFLPVTRNSLWNKMCGLPYERALRFHKYSALLLIMCTAAHMFSMVNYFGDWSVAWAKIPTVQGSGVLYGTISFGLMVVVVILSFEPFRRWQWEMFFLSHMLFVPIIVTAIYHDRRVLYYMLAPLCLYVIDHVVRFYYSYIRPWMSSGDPEILSVAVIGSEHAVNAKLLEGAQMNAKAVRPSLRLLRLELKIPGFHFTGGDYLFLNAPSIAMSQWHPFSISSSPYDPRNPNETKNEVFTLHIQDCGPGSWTHTFVEEVSDWLSAQKVFSNEHGVLAKVNNNKRDRLEWNLPLRIDGPYGKVGLDLDQYGCIVLAGGGSGIAPMYSILRTIIDTLPTDPKASLEGTPYPHLKQVHLIFTCRSATSFLSWFPELLSTMHPAYRHILHLHLYYTGAHSPSTEKSIATTAFVQSQGGGGGRRLIEGGPFVAPVRHYGVRSVEEGVAPLPSHASKNARRPSATQLRFNNRRREADGYVENRHVHMNMNADEYDADLEANQPGLVAQRSRAAPPPPPPAQPPTVPAPNQASGSACELQPLTHNSPPMGKRSNVMYHVQSNPPLMNHVAPVAGQASSSSSVAPVSNRILVRGVSIPSPRRVGDHAVYAAAAAHEHPLDHQQVAEYRIPVVDAEQNGVAPGGLVVPSPVNEGDEGQPAPQPSLLSPQSLTLINGRPVFPLIFDAIQSSYQTLCQKKRKSAAMRPIAALACGPDDMVLNVQKAAMERSWHIHKETFDF